MAICFSIRDTYACYLPHKQQIFCRTSSLWVKHYLDPSLVNFSCSLGRDPGYCSLNETFTLDVVLSSAIIKCFPDILRPLVSFLSWCIVLFSPTNSRLVGRYLTTVPKSVKRGIHYLGPTLEKRLSQEKIHGKDWAGQPVCIKAWTVHCD